MDRLASQLHFLTEVDRLKGILRRTRLSDGSRYENSAEHSWHIALAALTLADQAPRGTELARVIAMLLIHDIVEIDAGDTFAFAEADQGDKAEREQRAAERLFGLLPPDQAAHFRALWDEFEAQETEEARFANAMDRLQPLLLNMQSGGGSWSEHHVGTAALYRRLTPLRRYPALWAEAERCIAVGIERGWLRDEGGAPGPQGPTGSPSTTGAGAS